MSYALVMYIPVLPLDAPGIIYARGVPADPSPDIESFNGKDLSLILFEIGFCRDLGCHKKLKKKTEKYNPLVTTLRRYRVRVNLVCIPIGPLAQPSLRPR